MKRTALVVGINQYDADFFWNLNCCVDDARAMHLRLSRHGEGAEASNGEGNYASKELTSDDGPVTRAVLGAEIERLLSGTDEDGDVLFYFSGHGLVTGEGGFLVTQEGTQEHPGYPMSKLLAAANQSANRSVLIILDCCHSGQIGNLSDAEHAGQALIGPNVTVLAASAANEESDEGLEFSLFTELLLEALDGGAADVLGNVFAASIYAYIEHALSEQEQCPVYKSYSRRLNLVRKCRPRVSGACLARLPEWFIHAEMEYTLDPEHVAGHELEQLDKVAVLRAFSELRSGALLAADSADNLHRIALDSGIVRLTPRGRLYWSLARRGEFNISDGDT